ncbi:MAG TPA: hypothetical protein VFB49_04045 [Patescibacteria group bacterium]|nr:hypothetical protein [Patescibacteria group bacterium]
MQPLFESIAILFVLFLLLRVSLTRPRDAVRLRGGLIALNVVTGMLVGVALAVACRGLAAGDPPNAALGADPPASIATAYAEMGTALIRILPVLGLLLGGLGGHLVFGALWRRYLRDGPAAARAWLRRFQFLVCLAAVVFLVRRLL